MSIRDKLQKETEKAHAEYRNAIKQDVLQILVHMRKHSEEHFEQYQFSIGKINMYLDGHYQKMFSLVTKLEEIVDTNVTKTNRFFKYSLWTHFGAAMLGAMVGGLILYLLIQ